MKYYITIVNKKTLTSQYLERNKEELEKTILKEFGGWLNTRVCSREGSGTDEYCMAGETKDGEKVFSVLAVKNLWNI